MSDPLLEHLKFNDADGWEVNFARAMIVAVFGAVILAFLIVLCFSVYKIASGGI